MRPDEASSRRVLRHRGRLRHLRFARGRRREPGLEVGTRALHRPRNGPGQGSSEACLHLRRLVSGATRGRRFARRRERLRGARLRDVDVRCCEPGRRRACPERVRARDRGPPDRRDVRGHRVRRAECARRRDGRFECRGLRQQLPRRDFPSRHDGGWNGERWCGGKLDRHGDQLVRDAACVRRAQWEQRRGCGRGAEQTVHVRRPIADLRRTGRRADEHPFPSCRDAAVLGCRGGRGRDQRPDVRQRRKSTRERSRRTDAVPTATMSSTSPGILSQSGWMPGSGSPGDDGKPGQGGGGGGNGRLSSGSGGGGGCGGCGGAGGKPGQGGGASIALLSFQSSITLAGCSLDGRRLRERRQQVETPKPDKRRAHGHADRIGNLGGCPGGAGGAGAGGNGGQGGPGGLSLGIGYVGTPPTIDGAVVTQASTHSGITIGAPGAGGAGGLRGASAMNSTGPAGALGASGQPGVAAAVEAVP